MVKRSAQIMLKLRPVSSNVVYSERVCIFIGLIMVFIYTYINCSFYLWFGIEPLKMPSVKRLKMKLGGNEKRKSDYERRRRSGCEERKRRGFTPSRFIKSSPLCLLVLLSLPIFSLFYVKILHLLAHLGALTLNCIFCLNNCL